VICRDDLYWHCSEMFLIKPHFAVEVMKKAPFDLLWAENGVSSGILKDNFMSSV
jgi:hypothetical protein